MAAIYSFNLTPPDVADYNFDNSNYQNATLYVPDAAVEDYKTTLIWRNFQNIQGFDPTGIKGIEADGNNKQDVYYDISGRKLNAPVKGLNIINGKKVIIK